MHPSISDTFFKIRASSRTRITVREKGQSKESPLCFQTSSSARLRAQQHFQSSRSPLSHKARGRYQQCPSQLSSFARREAPIPTAVLTLPVPFSCHLPPRLLEHRQTRGTRTTQDTGTSTQEPCSRSGLGVVALTHSARKK